MGNQVNYKIPEAQADKWRPVISTQGWRRRMMRATPNRGLQLYPGVYSDDRATLTAHANIADRLSKITVKIDETGVLGPDAVPGDFYRLRTVAGYGMNPISVPPVSNEPIRRQLGLRDSFASDRDITIFDELVRLMFSRAAPSKVGIRREASTGAPDFVNDVPKKKAELRHALTNLPRFLSLVKAGKLLELFVDFNSPVVHTTGERGQADKVKLVNGRFVSTDREVNDEEAARSALERGRRFPADKRVFVAGAAEPLDGFFGTRRRTVYGTAFVPNYVLATFCSQWREAYFDTYAFTWKHREPEQILEKMKKFSYQVGFDVKQFDQTVPEFLLDRFLKRLALYVDDGVVELIRLLFKAPYMVPYPWMAGTSDAPFNPLFGDDPFDVGTFEMRLGLPSGIAINPDFGKLVMTFQYLVLFDRYFGDVLEQGVDDILRGQCQRYAMLNMGDDCVLLTNDSGFQAWFEKVQGDSSFAYFALEPERPISFLGNVPYRDEKGELKLAPNVISYLVNWLVPERGIDSRARMNFWAVGERERRLHYARAPRYPDVKAALEEEYERALGISPAAVAAEAYEHQKKFMGLSTIDALVLQNPEMLHYKVGENQVSEAVLDEIVTSLPADEVWPLISFAFK